MKWVYIKNGNVETQLKKLGMPPKDVPEAGTEAFIGALLKEVGSDPVLLVSEGVKSSQGKINNASYIVVSTGQRGESYFKRLGLTARAIAEGLIRIAMFRPDRIVCGKTGYMLWIAYLIAKIRNIPIVHSRHNSVTLGRNGFGKRIQAYLDAKVINKLDGVVCHGPYLVDEIAAVGVSRERIQEFDIAFTQYEHDVRCIQNLPEKISGLSKGSYICYVGRIESIKGVFDLLEAFQLLADIRPDMRLVYVGKGQGEDALHREINNKGLDDRVFMLGYQPHTMAGAIMKNSRCLVASTRHEFPEGRCMTVMEALVMGVPVIAPDMGPFPYLVKNGLNGYLYGANSIENMSAAISNIFVEENYNKTASGAAATGRALIHPPQTFGEAIRAAFSPIRINAG